jgi:hypothetical protein
MYYSDSFYMIGIVLYQSSAFGDRRVQGFSRPSLEELRMTELVKGKGINPLAFPRDEEENKFL